MTTLERLTPRTTLARLRSWAGLSDEELRRRATEAAASRETEELWSLTEANLVRSSPKGGKLSRHTLSTYKRGVKDLLEDWQGENLLRPSRDAGALWLAELEARGHGPSTLNVKLAAARALYNALAWSKATSADPFKGVRSRRDPVPAEEKRQPYSQKEIERLLEAAEHPGDRVVVLLGAHAGLRRAEIATARWRSFRGAQLQVVGKGGKVGTVALSKRLQVALRALGRQGETILPWGERRIDQRFRALCAEAGVDCRGLHALRHSAGTRAYRQTGDLKPVQKHLRHASVSTSAIYAKLADRQTELMVQDW